jgi:hypothetical protein
VTYTVPAGLHLSKELIEEYCLRFCIPGKNVKGTVPDAFYCENTGWSLSDPGVRDSPYRIILKNFALNIDNAAIAAKYGSQEQGTIL